MDLGLDDALTYDPNAQIELQVDATIRNLAAGTITPHLFVIVLTDGVMKIENGVVSTHVGIAETKFDPSKDCVAAMKGQRSGSYKGDYKFDVPTLINKRLERNDLPSN